MEIRSRKRAEASSSSSATTRAFKRLLHRPSPAPATRIRSRLVSSSSTKANTSAQPEAAPMDESSSRCGRRGRIHQEKDKGKEKDYEVRASREREPEMEKEQENERLNVEHHHHHHQDDNDDEEEDDDNDSEGGQNLTSPRSELQELLRKFAVENGMEQLLPSSARASYQKGRLKKILSGLRADGEDGKQVEALTQLCKLLSIGTKASLSAFSVDSFVPILVSLLNHESNPDIMLLAARAITHLADVLPSSTAAVVHYGAVASFVARLLTIEHMDLAKQVDYVAL